MPAIVFAVSNKETFVGAASAAKPFSISSRLKPLPQVSGHTANSSPSLRLCVGFSNAITNELTT